MENSQVLELYKVFVEMADRISDRRTKANRFYLTLLSGLLMVFPFINSGIKINSFNSELFLILTATGVIGILICLVWFINIRSYRQLNTAKFQVIHQMENKLNFSPYSKEWEILEKGSNSRKYLQLTRVEIFVPVILSIPYFFISIYALFNL